MSPASVKPNPDDAQEKIREVPFGSKALDDLGKRFTDNSVTTSKYTVLTFLPLNLFEQLQKAANVYFMLISLVMFIGEQTELYMESIQAYSTFLTLAAMMAASAVMAAMDDYRRHVADKQMNSRPTKAIRSGDIIDLAWDEVVVGDVIIVRGEEELPADIVPLACSGNEGCCYVSTANLDGETNLKLKAAAACTQASLLCKPPDDGSPVLDHVIRQISSIGGSVTAEAPQRSIHTFTGNMTLASDASEAEPLGPKQFLLRGTVLRNTAWCIGLVVYTGKDTRVVMNSRKSPMKVPNLEKVINVSMLVTLAAQGLMALVSDILYNVKRDTYRGYWYLYPGGTGNEIILPEFIGYWITFFILYSNLMPISLYATIEICNAVQGFYIKNDLEMYDPEFDVPAMVRSTNLCQEIGQVEYIFSDKTGTLTQNVMELKRIFVAGQVFGHVGEERGFQGGANVKAAVQKSSQAADDIGAFLEVLAVSHTVMVVKDKDGKFKYEAESPDEDALVSAVDKLGWSFSGRVGTTLQIKVDKDQKGEVEERSYEIRALNAFTSARKRMSVVVRNQAGEHFLFVKGADNVMLERASCTSEELTVLEKCLTNFAKEGLRTLVIGRRKLDEKDANEWVAAYERAQNAMTDRDGELSKVAEKIEKQIILCGATAIEDKLQVGVGDTISRLRGAGIKIWVLTGDKLETARNIGFSTNVLSDEMTIMVLDVEDEQNLVEQLTDMETQTTEGADGTVFGLMVTGQALEIFYTEMPVSKVGESRLPQALRERIRKYENLRRRLLEVARRCSVVIACRVSPLQKAQMVQLVRKGIKPTPVTLSVGDGANDVPMIQEAQVGVGICGREGRQAVNAADFAIGQFRFLQRLLLVHGRLNYRRTCKFTLYTFWRNGVQVLLMFYYSFMSGYSGLSLFEDKVRMTFNFILSIPIIATGIFDRDVSDQVVLEHSVLYETGRLGLDLSPRKMAETLLSAFIHSLVVLSITLLACPGMSLHDAGDYYTFGTTVYTCMIISSNVRVSFLTLTWNILSVLALSASFLLYIIFLIVYGLWKNLGPPMYSVPYHMVSNASFWLCAFAVPMLDLFVDFMIAYVKLEFFPDRKDLILESVKANKVQKFQPMEPSQAPVEVKTAGSAQTVNTEGQSTRLHTVGRPRSSFVFDSPEAPRNLSSLADQTAKTVDTSVVDTTVATPAGATAPSSKAIRQSETKDTQQKEKLMMSTEKPAAQSSTAPPSQTSQEPKESAFAQQKLPSWQFEVTRRKVAIAHLLSGISLILLGVLAFFSSQAAAQMRIQYEGASHSGPPGTTSEEVTYSRCEVSEEPCDVNIIVAKDMEPPILLHYVIDPFYQNFNSYVLSVVNSELEGKQVDAAKRKVCELSSTAEIDGQKIVPCGLRATSLFNDTFKIKGMDIDQTGIAWKSDVDRYENVPGYPDEEGVSFLHDRYRGIIEESKGVKDERFVAWMRPAALPRVQKRYGILNSALKKGQNLTITIKSNFPVASIEARKELVLTTLSSFGGRDDGLGLYLLIMGGLCLLTCILVALITALCPREPGEPRCKNSA